MLKLELAPIVNICTRHPWKIITISLILLVVSGNYALRHFAINTDVNKLISTDLPWRQRELAFARAFQGDEDKILAVVDAPTSELASAASSALGAKLSGEPNLFMSVQELSGSSFFTRNGLLFLPTTQVAATIGTLSQSQPLLRVLATDPSLRGLVQALSFGLGGVEAERYSLDQNGGSAIDVCQADRGRAGGATRELLVAGAGERQAARRKRPAALHRIYPVLDYGALEPGKKATDAIRQAAADLKLDTQYLARLRLTGLVPIADEEFATLENHAGENAIGTVLMVLAILWLALRSPKIIFAVFFSILVGLAITAALGLRMVGSLNPISIAFAVLFVGIGIDFGIQFSVRYRAERYELNNLRIALANTARRVGAPLTLAAMATAAGFLSSLPTDYRGVAELGEIAGVGMIIAYIISITLLPALLRVLNPPTETAPLGFSALAPVDRFMERNRWPIIVGTAVVVLGGLPLLYFLQFDFNPINLNSPKTELIATYLDLRSDPATGASTIEVLASSLAEARDVAGRLGKLPESRA